MTHTSSNPLHEYDRGDVNPVQLSQVEVQDTYWGYVVRTTESASPLLVIGQAVSWLTGLALAVAALGLWVAPGLFRDADLLALKMGLSVVLAGMSVLLLWYASRGTEIEVQIDTRKGEIREVVRNRTGRQSLVGRYGFDSIGGAFLDRKAGRRGEAALVLRYRNTANLVTIARGAIPQIERLKDRLGRDLLLDSSIANRVPAISPMPRGSVAA